MSRADVSNIAVEKLSDEIYDVDTNVRIPFNGRDYGWSGRIDVYGVDQDDTHVEGYIVLGDTSKIGHGLTRLATAQGYLEALGYNQDLKILLEDDSLLTMKQLRDEFPPVFSESKMEGRVPEDKLNDYRHFSVLNGLDRFTRTGNIDKDSGRFQSNDFEMLLEGGWIEENEDGSYGPTTQLDTLSMAMDEELLHFTERMDLLVHPDEL